LGQQKYRLSLKKKWQRNPLFSIPLVQAISENNHLSLKITRQRLSYDEMADFMVLCGK